MAMQLPEFWEKINLRMLMVDQTPSNSLVGAQARSQISLCSLCGNYCRLESRTSLGTDGVKYAISSGNVSRL